MTTPANTAANAATILIAAAGALGLTIVREMKQNEWSVEDASGAHLGTVFFVRGAGARFEGFGEGPKTINAVCFDGATATLTALASLGE